MSDSQARTEQPENGSTPNSESQFSWPKYGLFCLLLAIWMLAPILALSHHPFGQSLATNILLSLVVFGHPVFESKLRWFIAMPVLLAIMIPLLFGQLYLVDTLGIVESAWDTVTLWHFASFIYALAGALTIEHWLGLGPFGASKHDPEQVS